MLKSKYGYVEITIKAQIIQNVLWSTSLWKKYLYIFEKDLISLYTVQSTQSVRGIKCYFKSVRMIQIYQKKHHFLFMLLFIAVNHESRSQTSIFELWNLGRQKNQRTFDRILWPEDNTGTEA